MFDPRHSASTDVRRENAQLIIRPGTSISLETMKQVLEYKDEDMVLAQREARTKAKLANEKLASVSWLEEETKNLKANVGAFTQEKQTLEE